MGRFFIINLIYMKKKIQIGVLGWAGLEEYPYGGPTNKEFEIAEKVGELLALAGALVITGGKGGIMEFAAKGAKSKNGTTVGVITGPRRTSNEWIDIEIITGSKIAGFDEVLIPIMCDAVIVIGGGAGTLQEICVSYRNKTPIILISSSRGCVPQLLKQKFLDDRKTTSLIVVKNAEEAVQAALHHASLSM